MKKSILNRFLIGILLIALAGCKSRKEATTVNVPTVKPTSGAEILRNLNEKQLSFNTLSIKAKADLNINNNNNDVNMNIRIKNDEIIWVSVTAIAGIEVARALITPDSIKILNRLQSEYTKKSFRYIHQFANKQVDFKAIQALLTANAFPGMLNESSLINTSDKQIELSGTLSELVYQLLFNSQYNLIQNNLKDEAKGQNLSVQYADFINVSGKDLPQSVQIQSNVENRNIAINLKYNQITFNEALDFPFNVPKRFTVKN